jgi:hypothetical protein
MPKPTIISTLQAVLWLSLASTGTTNFNLSWLDNLPFADDPKLHDCGIVNTGIVNTRPLIAEVLEWQGRYKEAIRCVTSTHALFFALLNETSIPPQLYTNSNSNRITYSFAVCSCRTASRFQIQCTIEGACRADARSMSRGPGEHALSVSAFDAAIKLARRGRFLLPEALAIRDRALAGKQGAGSGLHWGEITGKQKTGEVMGRMRGPREPLARLMAV